MFLEVNTCYSHNCATVLSGECVAGGVRSYYKYLFFEKNPSLRRAAEDVAPPARSQCGCSPFGA